MIAANRRSRSRHLTLDELVRAILAALAGALGALGAAYLALHGKLAEVRISSRAADREANREDFVAFTAELRAELDRLREENERDRELRQEAEVKAERVAKELAEHRGATDARIAHLERQVRELHGQACPWGRANCPREIAPVVMVETVEPLDGAAREGGGT
jgi:hypothetical protein